MIQSPSQYPQGIAPQVAQQPPVQFAPGPQACPTCQAAPAGYYNYPTSNLYQYPQAQSYQPAQPSQANAVNIQIYNPQAYAGSQGAQVVPPAPVMPAQFVPVQAPVVNQIAQAPQVAPAPTPVPVTEATPAPVPPAPVIKEEAPAPSPAPAPTTEPQAKPVGVDVAAFNAKLHSANLDEQGAAIEQIAEMTQNDPTGATALLDTQIMEGLLGVIAKDTTTLQGPTPKQLELRQKLISYESLSDADKAKATPLTDAEKAEANTITPMEAAERNKQYALYTVAFLQNLLSSEVEKRNGIKLDIKDLPAIEQVVQTAKADPNPLLRVSALASLSHIAKPEYKPVLSQIFELAKTDSDPNVQEAAKKAAEQLAAMPDAPGAAPATPAAPATEAPAQPAAPAEAPKAEVKPEEAKKA